MHLPPSQTHVCIPAIGAFTSQLVIFPLCLTWRQVPLCFFLPWQQRRFLLLNHPSCHPGPLSVSESISAQYPCLDIKVDCWGRGGVWAAPVRVLLSQLSCTLNNPTRSQIKSEKQIKETKSMWPHWKEGQRGPMTLSEPKWSSGEHQYLALIFFSRWPEMLSPGDKSPSGTRFQPSLLPA